MVEWLLRIAKAFGFFLTPDEQKARDKAIQEQEELRRRISDELWI